MAEHSQFFVHQTQTLTPFRWQDRDLYDKGLAFWLFRTSHKQGSAFQETYLFERKSEELVHPGAGGNVDAGSSSAAVEVIPVVDSDGSDIMVNRVDVVDWVRRREQKFYEKVSQEGFSVLVSQEGSEDEDEVSILQ